MKQRSGLRYVDAILAPVLWFACLNLLYGIATLVCARPIGQAGMYVSLAVIVATLILLAWMAAKPRGDADPFARNLCRTLVWLSVLATLWLTLPLATQTGCLAH